MRLHRQRLTENRQHRTVALLYPREMADNIANEYFAHMESEHRIKERGKWLWLQIGSRPNHYFGCEAMQVDAATMLKIVGREAVRGEAEAGEDVCMPGAS